MARVKQTARQTTAGKAKLPEPEVVEEVEEVEEQEVAEVEAQPEEEVAEQVEEEQAEQVEAEEEEVEQKPKPKAEKRSSAPTSVVVYVEGTPRFKISVDNGDTIATLKASLPKFLKKLDLEFNPLLSRFFLIAGDSKSELDITGEENDELEIAAESEKSELYVRRYLFTMRKLDRLYPDWQEEMESITVNMKNKTVNFDIPDADLSKSFGWENGKVKAQIGRKRKFEDDFFLAWFEPELVEFMKTNERPFYQLSSNAELTPITGVKEVKPKAKRGRKPKVVEEVEEEDEEQEDEQKTEEVDEGKGKEEADDEEEEQEEDADEEQEEDEEDEE